MGSDVLLRSIHFRAVSPSWHTFGTQIWVPNNAAPFRRISAAVIVTVITVSDPCFIVFASQGVGNGKSFLTLPTLPTRMRHVVERRGSEPAGIWTLTPAMLRRLTVPVQPSDRPVLILPPPYQHRENPSRT